MSDEAAETPMNDLIQSFVRDIRKPDARLMVDGKFWSSSVGTRVTAAIADTIEAASTLKGKGEEIERLKAECFALAADTCHAGYAGEYGHHMCREVDSWKARAEAAESSLSRMKEALEPFAKLADVFDVWTDERDSELPLSAEHAPYGDSVFTVGDLRKARSALSQSVNPQSIGEPQ